jgi:aryl-alcohol dehydrogenase-like predicted oxidoreductase
MTLDTVPLGRTGMAITRTGLGCWAMGGGGWAWGWGAQDDAVSVATIQHAVDLGVNWIDTAAEYGLGHAEEVVGRALRDIPEGSRPFVFTKGGLVWDPADRRAPTRGVAAAASLRRECDASLRRLGVERIDLYQLHWPPDDGTPMEEYWGTLLDLRASGKVRAVGLSNFDAPTLEAAEKLGHVETLQPPFSAIDRRAGADVIPWCGEHGTGVIVYSPMQSGLLTGEFSASRVASLPADDWRRASPDFTSGLPANLALSGALQPVADRYGVTRAAIAVAWTLAFPAVTGAIVGARRPSQVDDWIRAASLELTESDLAEIAAAIRATGAGRPASIA